MSHEEIAVKINTLISEYSFPLEVLQDIKQRLSDCQDVHYAAQQQRYLQNIIKAGMVRERGEI